MIVDEMYAKMNASPGDLREQAEIFRWMLKLEALAPSDGELAVMKAQTKFRIKDCKSPRTVDLEMRKFWKLTWGILTLSCIAACGMMMPVMLTSPVELGIARIMLILVSVVSITFLLGKVIIMLKEEEVKKKLNEEAERLQIELQAIVNYQEILKEKASA